jgi:hypothetical protein
LTPTKPEAHCNAYQNAKIKRDQEDSFRANFRCILPPSFFFISAIKKSIKYCQTKLQLADSDSNSIKDHGEKY